MSTFENALMSIPIFFLLMLGIGAVQGITDSVRRFKANPHTFEPHAPWAMLRKAGAR
jgi:hypothetical protein